MVKNTDLFIHQNEIMDFPVVLNKVQAYFSEHYKELMLGDTADSSEQLKAYIQKYLTDNRLSVKDMDQKQLTDKLFREMAEYSFLTPYLNFETEKVVEGIEIDSWECIWIKFAGGEIEQSNETFFSPKHARDVMIRLLHQSKISTDPSHPLARGHKGKNIRITVNCGGGTLDDDAGISASIRFINPKHLTRSDLIQLGTLTPDMMDFFVLSYRYKLSEMLAGETDAGKTTLMGVIMEEAVPNDKKLITIENGTREFNLIKRDPKTGKIINSVIHLVTRDSDDVKQEITQQMLLEWSMTANPDHLCMAEVKGSEAFETIEAALTGHPVIGTTHTKDAATIPDRLVQLASIKSSTLSDKTLYSMAVNAFPILIYTQKMADGVRRVTEISECRLKDGRPNVIPLWRYVTHSNEIVNGKAVIHGEFVKCGIISEDLQDRLRRNGMPESVLQTFLKGGAA